MKGVFPDEAASPNRFKSALRDVANSMPEYVDPEVATLRDSESDEAVTLLLGVSGDREAFGRRVAECGGTVEAEIGRATVRVTAPASAVDALCGLDGLRSIEVAREDVRVG